MNVPRDETFFFRTVCRVLEGIDKSSKSANKKKEMTSLFDSYGDRKNIYPLIRLILPQFDSQRGAMNVKEAKLKAMVIRVYGFKKSDRQYKMIDDHKAVTVGTKRRYKKNVGDLVEAIYEAIKDRAPSQSSVSVRDVNQFLDDLATKTDQDERFPLMKAFCMRATAVEQKWLFKIILKDLKMGMGEDAVLRAYHEDAPKRFKLRSDLKLLCEELWDRNERFTGQDIEPMVPVAPMLSGRTIDFKAVKAWLGRREGGVVVESKYDGDRIMIHKQDDRVELYSRNCHEANFETEGFKRRLAEAGLVKARSCVIDGEMMVWDNVNGVWAPFASIRGKENFDGRGTHEMVYIAFDLLYVDGESLLGRPLRERRERLWQVLEARPRLVEAPDVAWGGPGRPSVDDVVDAFDRTVRDGFEGLILKDAESAYEPADRRAWAKIKPDYMDETATDLDLVVLGAYLGTGARYRGGDIAGFLLGVCRPASNPQERPRQFLSFAKVGSGFNAAELTELRNLLKPHLKQYDHRSPPPEWWAGRDWAPRADDRPRYWVDPREANVVIEVRAYEVIACPSDLYRAEATLRFPRFQRVRRDKSWWEAMDLRMLKRTMEERRAGRRGRRRGGRRRRRHAGDPGHAGRGRRRWAGRGGEASRKKRKKEAAPRGPTSVSEALLPHLRPTDVSGVARCSSALEGASFVVYGQPPGAKAEAERRVAALGGKLLSSAHGQHPPDAVLLAGGDGVLKVPSVVGLLESLRRGAANTPDVDVLRASWLEECAAEGRRVPPTHAHIVRASAATAARLREAFDPFGDSYTEPTGPDALRPILARVPDDERTVPVEEREGLEALEGEWRMRRLLFGADSPLDQEARDALLFAAGNCFRLHVFYFPQEGVRGSQVRLTKEVALARGARVAPRLCPAVTHIVVAPEEAGAEEVLAGLVEERRALLREDRGGVRVRPVLRPAYVHESAEAADAELDEAARPDARLHTYKLDLPEPAPAHPAPA
eukprot:tig00001718_g9581.t1